MPRPLHFPRARTRVLLALLLGLLGAIGCRRGSNYCDAAGVCGCQGERECFIVCGKASCDVSCSQTAEACGVVCQDDCNFDCSDTNHCSSFSGARSTINCHSLPSCASECGVDCDYNCSDVSECSVTVGDRSKVDCRSTADCDVTCQGDCDVTCSDVSRCLVGCDGPCTVDLRCDQVATCDVRCKSGLQHSGNGSGVHTCK